MKESVHPVLVWQDSNYHQTDYLHHTPFNKYSETRTFAESQVNIITTTQKIEAKSDKKLKLPLC